MGWTPPPPNLEAPRKQFEPRGGYIFLSTETCNAAVAALQQWSTTPQSPANSEGGPTMISEQ